MTDYKALCARMADELDHYRQLLMDDRRETHALATEARAALAQPETEKAVNWAAYFARQAAAQEKELQDALAQLLRELATDNEMLLEVVRQKGGLSLINSHKLISDATSRARQAAEEIEGRGEPTKAEIHALADELLDGDRASRVDFARAVLARWGSL
jgi:hypothetical protein